MFKRPCPHVPVYVDNEDAIELMMYFRAGGWLEQMAVVRLTEIQRENPARGTMLTHRISAALASKEYREATDAVKPPKPRRTGKSSSRAAPRR